MIEADAFIKISLALEKGEHPDMESLGLLSRAMSDSLDTAICDLHFRAAELERLFYKNQNRVRRIREERDAQDAMLRIAKTLMEKSVKGMTRSSTFD